MKNINSKKAQWFNQFFESSSVGIFIVNKNRENILVNKRICDMFGYTEDEILGKSAEMLHVSNATFLEFATKAFDLAMTGKSVNIDYQVKKKDGTLFWSNISGSVLGNKEEVIWLMIDITQRIEAIFELKKKDKQFTAINNLINLGHWEYNFESKIVKISDEMSRLLGLENQNSITYNDYIKILHPDDRKVSMESLKTLISGSATEGTHGRFILDENGKEKIRYVYQKGMIVYDENGKAKSTIGATIDISGIKKLEEEIENQKKLFEHQAHHDYLTGLPNRTFLMANLDHILKSAKREGKKVAAIFIDLDDFKLINDTLGHSQGDIFLKEISSQMKEELRDSDILARLGGDEFVVILDDIKDEKSVLEVVKKFLNISQKPVVLKGENSYAFMSIGIAMYPNDGQNVEELISNADAAMYKAKNLYGKNTYAYYSEDISKQLHDKIDMGKSIMNAIENDEFVVYYQPQINADKNKIVGIEALVRWQHPTRGLIFPNDFLHVAEELHMMKFLNLYVIKKAVKQYSKWRRDGKSMGILALNMAKEQLECPECYDNLTKLLKKHKCNPEWIEMEVTEGTLITKEDMAIELLINFKKLGVKIAIDDFGTGYSSLAYLKNLPIDKLKIDKSFVDNITSDMSDLAITRTIIELANNLNLEVIAEGVETKEQKEILQKNGCSNIQGYYYSKPISAEDMEKFYDDFTTSL